VNSQIRAEPRSPVAVSEHLRRSLVADLRRRRVIRSDLVEAAFLGVPRERFVPGVAAEHGLEAVYEDEALVTKRDAGGMPVSSSSQPALMAEMLELLGPLPGDRVLEIGTGTGYNAALIAHIVGPRGRVTSIDVDSELARQARRSLRDADYRASIAVGDGRAGYPRAAPYDRIIVTACADEIPRAWLEQLRDRGRVELPLRLDPDGAAIQIIPVLERRGRRLESVGLTWGGFMPLHDGDGGWRRPPAALNSSRSAKARHTMLASITGAGIEQLSDSVARKLLAWALTNTGPPRRHGVTDFDSARPPLLLLYLLLSIPASRRVSLTLDGRLGIGVVDRRSQSLAVVSVRSPWTSDTKKREVRARWRLDVYGNGAAVTEIDDLLDTWRELKRTGHTKLQITAEGPASALDLSFAWSRVPRGHRTSTRSAAGSARTIRGVKRKDR
jgi:protein-L-isoaspartate(D-aspartate) O-methyltransferase